MTVTVPAAPSPPVRALAPPALLAGVVCAFVVCCLAGRVVASRNPFVGFQRFHRTISPETLFYPTASQVRALGREQLDRNRVAVVVGGSSIMRGFGQRAEELWTRHLQEKLGDDYRVLNLAMNCGFTAEFGGTAAEMLARDFPRLIFLTDVFPFALTGPGAAAPAGAKEAALPRESAYGYFFWDAYYKGLLSANPRRLQAISAWLRTHSEDSRLAELVRGLRLDGLTYSRDLWSTLGYAHLSTTLMPSVSPPFVRPRWKYADLDGAVATSLRRSPLPPLPADTMLTFLHCATVSGRPDDLVGLAESHVLVFPPALGGRTLLLPVRHSPGYERRLSPGERASYQATFPALVRRLEALGFVALDAEAGCGEEDFLDFCHLSESGGRKLAAEVAPAVRRLARRLGYDREGSP